MKPPLKFVLEFSRRNTFLIILHFLKPQRRFCTPQNPFAEVNYLLLFDKNLTKMHWAIGLRLLFEPCSVEGGIAVGLTQEQLSHEPIYNFFSNVLTMV